MANTTKKCPMCAEQIPTDAVFCPYCGTRFGEKAKAAPPPAAPAAVVSPPVAQVIVPLASATPTPARKNHAGLWIAGVIVPVIILGAIGIILWIQRAKIPAFSALIATTTPTATITLPPTLTPTTTPTRTPRPTATATPLPSWVADFAQPILDAIANRAPNVQEDFNTGRGGWKTSGCIGRIEYLDGEMLLTGCGARRSNIDFSDFVVEFDARIYPGASGDSAWCLNYKNQEDIVSSPENNIQIFFSGDVSLHFYKDDTSYDFPHAANSGNQSNHILVIGKGTRIAVYLNNQPLFYYPSSIRYGGFEFQFYGVTLAVDNFRIWNIYDVSIP